jgi:hypothetical protein
MRPNRLALVLVLGACLFGCAASQVPTEVLRTLMAKHLVVSLPEEAPFPNQMTLSLSGAAGQSADLGNQMLETFGTSSLEQKIGAAVKNSGTPLNRQISGHFARELRSAGLFAGVTSSGGDAQLVLSVTRWGLAWDDRDTRYEPILDMEATLSVPPMGVVWRNRRSVDDLSMSIKGQIAELDPAFLATQPQKLVQGLNFVAEELSRQLVEDLRGKSQPR